MKRREWQSLQGLLQNGLLVPVRELPVQFFRSRSNSLLFTPPPLHPPSSFSHLITQNPSWSLSVHPFCRVAAQFEDSTGMIIGGRDDVVIESNFSFSFPSLSLSMSVILVMICFESCINIMQTSSAVLVWLATFLPSFAFVIRARGFDH